MSNEPIPPSRWQRLLASLSRAYRRWPVDVETRSALGGGDRAVADLDDLSFDPAADRVEIRCGRHQLAVAHPTRVSLCGDGADRALEVEGRKGTLLLRFHAQKA